MLNMSTAPGYIPAASDNPLSTTGSADYVFQWGEATRRVQVRHVMIQNNTNSPVSWDLDTPTSAGSPIIPSGATFFLDCHCSALHLQTAANQAVNGSTGANVVVRGWL